MNGPALGTSRLHLFVGTLLALALIPSPTPASACTPGPPTHPLEEIAVADAIAIVSVDSVRGPENRAPTVTPEVASPPIATPVGPIADGMPDDFTLAGYGATLRLERVIAGGLEPTFEVDEEPRAALEKRVRVYEAGHGSNCMVSDPRLRYAPGARYLVFLHRSESSLVETTARFELVEDAILVGEFIWDEAPPFFMTPESASAFFSAHDFQQFEGQDLGQLRPGSVPLATVLRAVAYLRGDPRIYPPDTGSAGLLAARSAR